MKCLKCNAELTENMQICPVCGYGANAYNNNIETSSNFNNTNIAQPNLQPINMPNIMNTVNQSIPDSQTNVFNPINNIESANVATMNNEVLTQDINSINPTPTNNFNTPVENISVSNSVESTMASNNINVQGEPTPVSNNVNVEIPNNNQTNNMEVYNNTTLMQPTNNIEPTVNNINNKSKNTKPGIIIAFLLIVIIAGGVIGGMFLLKPNPKKVYSTIISETKETVLTLLNSEMYTANTVTTEFSLKPTLKTTDDELKEIYDIINKMDINGKYQIDYVNKKMLIDLNSKYNNKESLNINAYVQNEKLYLNLENVYDKYLTTDVEGFNEMFELIKIQKDITTLIDEAMKAFESSLKDEYFISEKEKMNVNGKETSVNKMTLVLNYDNTMNLVRDTLTKLKSNDKYLDGVINITKSYSSLYMTEELTKEELIKQIEETIEKTKEEPNSKEGEIRINLYTKGLKHDFVGIEMNIKDEYENSKISLINDKENTYTLTIKSDDEEHTLPIKKENDTYILEYSEDGVKVAIRANFNTNEYKFDLNSEDITLTGDYTITKDKMTGKVLGKVEGNEVGLEASVSYKYNEVENFPQFSNTVDIEEISDEDAMNIYNKLMESTFIKYLIIDYNNRIHDAVTPSYDYNNDYEYDYNIDNIYSY